MFNRTTLLVLAAALAAGLGLLAARFAFAPQTTHAPPMKAVHLIDPPRAVPAFSLRQSDGTPLVPGELKGHWTLVFLGFTHCPDLCPTTLAELARAQKQWESLPETTRPRVLFVSVDPDRDTPDRVGEYAHAFHRDTIAATADVPTLERFARSVGLVFAKSPPAADAPADAYAVDHSATLVALDPDGRMAGIVQPPLDAGAIASDFTQLTKAAP
ncbi:SCO family protein [Cognatilysobacter lacus]|uniref:SCO family protein n=1 Tax=Cognatilysobacter lacus TaxID=1643323 RepID=A0A5D8YZV6_9GAMM|nr:SCO family protein [Lysobacter lacus]TZF88255.1 SCO family protein [Lysobacter lacus]